MADLVAAGYRVATVDLRGQGGSSTGWPAYDEPAIADDLVALTEHLAAPGERAVLIGNSYSGGAAVVTAARRPGLVAGLVLTGAFVRTVPRNAVQNLALWLVTGTPFGRQVWTAYYPSLLPGAKPADFAAYRAALKANLAEPGRFAAVAAMGVADHDAAEAALPRVAAPALVVMGTKDPDFADPAAEARLTAVRLGDLQRRLRLAGLRELDEALRTAAVGRSSTEALRAVGHAYRRYAREHPGRYVAGLRAPDADDDADVAPVVARLTDLMIAVLRGHGLEGDDALHAVRGVRAALHGFVALEQAGGFGLPQDVDTSFERLLVTLDTGLRHHAGAGEGEPG